jgi:hypothetical protein
MRLVLPLLIGSALVAGSALAAPDTGAFQRMCRTKVPAATCDCVVMKMSRTRDGQILLDAVRLLELPKDQQQARAVELANKYGATMTQIRDALQRSKPEIDSVMRQCI